MKQLDDYQVYNAIVTGITEVMPRLSEDQMMKAVSDGVYNAIWSMITNATSMPCNDFYDTIKEAAEKAFSDVAMECPKSQPK